MMDNLRAAANNVVLKILLALIALSFVLTGVGGYVAGDGGDYAAEVNGQQISRAQLEQAVQNERSRQQESMGAAFSTLASQDGYMQQMRQQVLSQLIDETLLDQYAATLGLAISDEQVRQAIFNIPAFRTDNQFDNAKYRAMIANMGLSADQYAQLMRKQLLTQQLIQGLAGTGFMLPEETERLLSVAVQSRQARLATFDIAALAQKQTVSDDEIQSSYQQNKEKYLSPEAFQVSYLMMDAAAIMDKTTVSDAEVQSYYDQHQEQFAQPARKRYSIIQSNTEADAAAVLDQLKKGADFATLAKEKSLDAISGKNGGDIGWMEEGSTVEELQKAQLNDKGQLSGVITSSVGFLVARLDDIQPQQVKPLAAVRDQVAAKVKQEKSLDAYYAEQQKASDAASNDNESLESAQAAIGGKIIQTDWFTRDNLPEALNTDAVSQVLFNGSLLGSNGAPGNNSDLVTLDGDRALILRISGHRPESIQPLEKVRGQVELQVKREKAIRQARVDAQKLLVSLKQAKADDALKSAGIAFSDGQTYDSAMQNDALSRAIFALPQPQQGKSSYGMSEDAKGNIVLVALESVTPRKLDDQQRGQFVSQLNQGMTGVTFDALINDLRSDAKIKMGSAAQMQ